MSRQKSHPGQAWLLAGNISLNLPDDRPMVTSGTFQRANPKGEEPGVFLDFAGRREGYWGQYYLVLSPEEATRVGLELLAHAALEQTGDLIDALYEARDDLAYRVDQGKDYDKDDIPGIEARLARWDRLMEALAARPKEDKA